MNTSLLKNALKKIAELLNNNTGFKITRSEEGVAIFYIVNPV